MPTGECGYQGQDCEDNSPAAQYRDYVYGVLHTEEERKKNSQIAELILNGGTELVLTTVAPPVGLFYKVINNKRVSSLDLAFGLIPFGLVGDLGRGVGNLDNLPINEVREIVKNSTKVEKALQVAGEARTEGQFLDDALKFIGSDYQELYPGVFRSQVEGGFRQVRFLESDLLDLAHGPHGHLEYLDPFGSTLLNIHVPLLGE